MLLYLKKLEANCVHVVLGRFDIPWRLLWLEGLNGHQGAGDVLGGNGRRLARDKANQWVPSSGRMGRESASRGQVMTGIGADVVGLLRTRTGVCRFTLTMCVHSQLRGLGNQIEVSKCLAGVESHFPYWRPWHESQ